MGIGRTGPPWWEKSPIIPVFFLRAYFREDIKNYFADFEDKKHLFVGKKKRLRIWGSNAFYERIKSEMMIINMDKPEDKTVTGN